jgi:hypothetical protein
MYFSKRHYIFFAEFLKSTQATTKAEFREELMKHFAIDNPKFNKAKFLKAVGCA